MVIPFNIYYTQQKKYFGGGPSGAGGAPTIFKEEGDLMRFSGGLGVGIPKVVRFG